MTALSPAVSMCRPSAPGSWRATRAPVNICPSDHLIVADAMNIWLDDHEETVILQDGWAPKVDVE